MSADVMALEALPAETQADTGYQSCHFTWTGTTQDTLCDPNLNTRGG
jgi:hypothetical protein